MRTAEARLWRFLPPFTRTVTLRQITVQGFMDMVRGWLGKGGRIGRDDFIAHAVTFLAGAAKMRSWATQRNALRLLEAAAEIHNWDRLYGCLNLTGKPKKGLGIMGDVHSLARIWNVIPDVVLGLPMERFLDTVDFYCAKIEYERRSEDPTLDPDAEAAPPESLKIPGMAIH